MKELPIKNEFASGLLELVRLTSSERIDSSRLVSSKPLWLMSVTVEADNAGNKTQCILINGETSSGEILFNLKAQYAHPTHCGCFPFYFNRGLYIDLTDNVNAVTIQYLVDSP